ncbi:carboxypeptidase regulatory-like domain-containing protein, partial [bacterium]
MHIRKEIVRVKRAGGKKRVLFTSMFLFFILSLSLSLPSAFADEGNINSTNKYAWSENTGWNNYRPTHGGVTVTAGYLSGYLWCENIGWVHLGAAAIPPLGATTWLNTTKDNYGVNRNTVTGDLSGYGWSENAGWINFAPTHATGGNKAKIDNITHDFSGYVWGENVGWIKLAGAAQPPDSTAYKVSFDPGALDHFDFVAATPQISGTAFTGVNTLTAKDSGGNTITAFNASTNIVALTSNPADGTITGLGSGNNNVLNQAGDFTNGVANLTALMKFTGTAGSHTFTATSADSKTGTSGTVTITTGSATKLGINIQPGGGTASTVWAQQPVVLIQDAGGNTITTDETTVVTAAIGTNPPGDGSLSGTVTATAVHGVATFTNLKIDKSGSGYTLNFTSSPVLTGVTSATFNIIAGAATKILVETAADGTGIVLSARSIAQGATVTGYAIARDVSNNFIENTVADSWSLPTKTGGVVDGDLVAAGDKKSAVFTGHVVGTGVIRAAKTGYASTDSGIITVTAGAATKLAMQIQPGGGIADTVWTTQPVILIQDASGNIVTTDSATTVTAAIGTNPGGGTLTGTSLTVQAVNGVVTFAGLKINKSGTGYTLNFTSTPALTGVTSSTFNITASSATQIRVETAADGSGTVVPFQSIAQGATVTGYAIARDVSNNFIENTVADSWSLPTKTGGVVDGDLVAAGDKKSAVFTGHGAGTGVIRAAKAGLASTDSGTLTVTTVPTVISTAYTQASRKLTITFNENIDFATFTAATLSNLSIQDQLANIVTLSGATIITTANSTVMEATLTVAEDNALYAIRANALRLVVAASCGIKDLAAQELVQNTYATSAYLVTYNAAAATPITGTLMDSKSGLIIANATTKLYDSAGNLRAETISDTSGNFSFNVNVPSGDYSLNITQLPFFKNKVEAISLTAGTAEAAGDVLIDPFGIVYDSITGELIAGANVILYTVSGNIYTGSPQPNPQSSRFDGGYNFDVAPGTYYLGATKDGYANYTGANFIVVSDIVEWNIPMVANNQSASTYLSIIKQANKKVVTAGDIITYTINIK